LTALGSRGLTWAPLLADLVAAQALGEPWPIEQELADAMDPARWLVRAARAASRPGEIETSR
jgi:tRNA 5-methylaminomethyl-2-thiouridine biosynthesis bifunctional protein